MFGDLDVFTDFSRCAWRSRSAAPDTAARRKKVPVADRQPLMRPQDPNEVWSADFISNRTGGRQRPRVLRAGHVDQGVTLRLIEPGKPGQKAFVESFHSRFRDECLNEHWLTTLAHAQAVIESWRREHNEERPKKGLGGVTPAHYAKQLAEQQGAVTVGL